MKPLLSAILTLLFLNPAFCQETSSDQKNEIGAILENYFDLEREAIHLHLNKTAFLTQESIWYKGYIINRKTNKPYFTTNVYVTLYDGSGKQLSEKLIYATNGVFSGKIDLKADYPTGEYYIQTYTNWMNNFSENESTITKINIINPQEGTKNFKRVNQGSLEITLTPEGNSFISGIQNQVGIQLKDCRGNSPENTEANLVNSQNEVLKTIKLNKFGYGKFETIPTGELLKVVVNYEGRTIEKALPVAEPIGFAMTVNNVTMDGKTVVEIRTNEATANLMKNKKIYLLAHQDQKNILTEINISASALATNFAFNNNDLFEGINTIRIIDSDLKQWTERLVYTAPKTSTNLTVSKAKNSRDKINLTGNNALQNSNISVSVLPDNSKSWDNNNSIIAGITINPYLINPIENADYYLSNPGRQQRYELDLVLLNQEKLKYDWSNFKINAPKANYTFDTGLILKGTVDPSIKDKTYHQMKAVSTKDLIVSSTDIDEKGEYKFEHLLISDSTYVKMSLEKLPDFNVVNTKITPLVLNRKRVFNKPFLISASERCPMIEIEKLTQGSEFPEVPTQSIQLEEVKVVKESKKLTFDKVVGNSFLRSFKVDEVLERQDLLTFIEQNGFKVVREFGHISIISRLQTNSGLDRPLITIDGQDILSQTELTTMRMIEIDEIYLDPHAIVPSIHNYHGVIRIYRKKNIKRGYDAQDQNIIFIKDGFAPYEAFKNIDYGSSQNEGFDNYGLIGWSPLLLSGDDGSFIFNVTNYNKRKAKVIVEGMSPEGELFHQETTVDLK